MVFSDSTTKLGIVEQARKMARLNATQFPVSDIVASCNAWLDELTGYLIGSDKRFQWDDTNHTKLPIGTTDLVANQSDYSFLTDQQGNKILTLTRLDLLQNDGTYKELDLIDQRDIQGALSQYKSTAGTPDEYDKIADNIVRLYAKPSFNKTAGLMFYFQRTASYFDASSTTKEPGVPPLLHRGFVVASAYDAALSYGLKNLGALGIELEKERQKVIRYFTVRNRDQSGRMMPARHSNK